MKCSVYVSFSITENVTHTRSQGPRLRKISKFYCFYLQNTLKLGFWFFFSSFKLKEHVKEEGCSAHRCWVYTSIRAEGPAIYPPLFL